MLQNQEISEVIGVRIEHAEQTVRDGRIISLGIKLNNGKVWRIDPLANKSLYSEILLANAKGHAPLTASADFAGSNGNETLPKDSPRGGGEGLCEPTCSPFSSFVETDSPQDPIDSSNRWFEKIGESIVFKRKTIFKSGKIKEESEIFSQSEIKASLAPLLR